MHHRRFESKPPGMINAKPADNKKYQHDKAVGNKKDPKRYSHNALIISRQPTAHQNSQIFYINGTVGVEVKDGVEYAFECVFEICEV